MTPTLLFQTHLHDCSLTLLHRRQHHIHSRHQAAQCCLKILWQKCKGRHLQALHDVNAKSALHDLSAKSATEAENLACFISIPSEVLYLDRRFGCGQVLLKACKVLLRNGPHTLETYAILDDGSERTIHLPAARLQLTGQPEDLALWTVR